MAVPRPGGNRPERSGALFCARVYCAMVARKFGVIVASQELSLSFSSVFCSMCADSFFPGSPFRGFSDATTASAWLSRNSSASKDFRLRLPLGPMAGMDPFGSRSSSEGPLARFALFSNSSTPRLHPHEQLPVGAIKGARHQPSLRHFNPPDDASHFSAIPIHSQPR